MNKQESPEKKTLRGFAKGWVIFMIVYVSAFGLSTLQYADKPGTGGIMLPFLLFSAVMVTGLSFLLKKKVYGFLILLAGGVLITAMNGAAFGNYTVISSGGLVLVFLTWLFTSKQIEYRFWEKRGGIGQMGENPAPSISTAEETQQNVAALPSEAAAVSTGLDVAPDPAAFETEVTRPAEKTTEPEWAGSRSTQVEPPAPTTLGHASERAKKKVNWVAVGGITVFAAVIVMLLVSGLLWKNAAVGGPPATVANSAGTEASAQPAQNADTSHALPAHTQELKQTQHELLNTLVQKFPEALPCLAKEVTSDNLFLAAVAQASYVNPVFDEHGVTITLLLPDPRKSSLDKLGIEPYASHSGARAYISENYEKLCRMDTPDRIEYSVTLHYQDGIEDAKTLDWTLKPIYWKLYDYSQVFEQHVAQYMSDMGFHDAAIEILMPGFDSAAGADLDAAYMSAYFSDLAAALELKGVSMNGETIMDGAKIEQILKDRLTRTWIFDPDSLVVKTEYFQPYLHIRSLESIEFFWRVREGLNAQYQSGSSTAPSSFDALEDAYLSAEKELAHELLSSTKKNPGCILDKEYEFDWETLGNEGISACPELVGDIRTFMQSYDEDLMHIADSFNLSCALVNV